MKTLSEREVKRLFGIDSEQVEAMEKDAAAGILHGDPRGEVVRGRPPLFGEDMRQVGFKETNRKVEAIDRRAQKLGMKRSDYLRFLVDADLRLSGELPEKGENEVKVPVVKLLSGSDAEVFRARWKKRAVLAGAEARQGELEPMAG